MAIEVFNRFENKYLIDADTFYELTGALHSRMVPDVHNPVCPDKKDGKHEYAYYTISNIYYDTEDDYLIRQSLSHPLYKEKLRLRSYGVPGLNDIVFLELKKKFQGIVNKRRTKIPLCTAYTFLNGEHYGTLPEPQPCMNLQVLKEIGVFLKRYALVPKVYIAYDRLAFFDKNSGDLRISFDKNIRTRRHGLQLEKGDFGDSLILENQRLMEIKSAGAMPLWLSALLSELGVFKKSFSKYGTEYTNYLQAGREPAAPISEIAAAAGLSSFPPATGTINEGM